MAVCAAFGSVVGTRGAVPPQAREANRRAMIKSVKEDFVGMGFLWVSQ